MPTSAFPPLGEHNHATNFKARPVNKAVMDSAGDLGVPRVVKKAPTMTKEFNLSSRPTSARKPAEPSYMQEKPVFSSFGKAAKPLPPAKKPTSRPTSAASTPRTTTTTASNTKPAAPKVASVAPKPVVAAVAEPEPVAPAVVEPEPVAAEVEPEPVAAAVVEPAPEPVAVAVVEPAVEAEVEPMIVAAPEPELPSEAEPVAAAAANNDRSSFGWCTGWKSPGGAKATDKSPGAKVLDGFFASGLSVDQLRAMQAQFFADDVPIEPGMERWTVEQAEAYFESGGETRPEVEPEVEPTVVALEPPASPAAELIKADDMPTPGTAEF